MDMFYNFSFTVELLFETGPAPKSPVVIQVLLAPFFLIPTASGSTGQLQGFASEFYCRNTNTSIYAEVCSPDFTEEILPNENRHSLSFNLSTIHDHTSNSIGKSMLLLPYVPEDPCLGIF